MPPAPQPPGQPASAQAPRRADPLAAAPSRRRDKGLLQFEEPAELDLDLRERLLDLAYDVSSYLRRHSQPAIRISAALLVAASIAACSSQPQPTTALECAAASSGRLAGEVRENLPTAPGRYPIVATSLARDGEGVYHFRWRDPGTSAGPEQPARASRLQLARSDGYELEVPAAGDPVLHVGQNAQFALCGGAGSAHSSYFGYWRPFYIGSGYLGPGYYDPPPRTISTNGHVDGSRYSANPRPLSERTYSVPGAVSGRAGGARGGAAATKKAGLDPAASVGKTGVAAARSSGFSGGKGGGSGGGGG